MRTGQARKRDTTEARIVQVLRQVGASVIRISEAGAPDLLVLWRSRIFLLEAKSPKGRATAAQERRTAQGWPVSTVRSPLDALEAIGVSGRDIVDAGLFMSEL